MIHTPNGSSLPCVRAFHKINAGYAVTTSLATLHCIRRATKHDAIFTARDSKAQRRTFAHARNYIYALASQKICVTSVKIILLNEC